MGLHGHAPNGVNEGEWGFSPASKHKSLSNKYYLQTSITFKHISGNVPTPPRQPMGFFGSKNGSTGQMRRSIWFDSLSASSPRSLWPDRPPCSAIIMAAALAMGASVSPLDLSLGPYPWTLALDLRKPPCDAADAHQ
jgi:hypothetical protein